MTLSSAVSGPSLLQEESNEDRNYMGISHLRAAFPVLAQDIPGQKLGNLRFCDSPYEIVVVTNDDSLWESRVKTNTGFELYASYALTLLGRLGLPG